MEEKEIRIKSVTFEEVPQKPPSRNAVGHLLVLALLALCATVAFPSLTYWRALAFVALGDYALRRLKK